MGKIYYNKLIILCFKFFILIRNVIFFLNYFNWFNDFHFIKTPFKKNIKINYINKINSYESFILEKINFNISLIRYFYSFKFNMMKIEYNIVAFEENNNLINPSYLSKFYKLHIFCHIIDINSNISIKDISNILNKKYNCIDFLKINQKIKAGITISKINKYSESFTKYLFDTNLINYNSIYFQNNEIFDPLIQVNKLGIIKTNNIHQRKNNQSILLKSSFYIIPKFTIKYQFPLKNSKWHFKNIYNHYFCFCKYSNNSKCFYKTIKQKCKYNLYLNIIDNNRNLYKKTDYLFADFSSPETSTCEAYIVFNEMIKRNFSAHYMTKREDIYEKFKNFETNVKLPIIFDGAFINGDFLEKYLYLFLKLKAVISGAKIFSLNNLFYNIEYITYICLGHGISYLKDFLYKDYYSYKIYNKILLPPSKLIISNAKKFGWKNKDIIKIGLPRWDIFIRNDNKSLPINIYDDTNNKSIFAMFTWRKLQNNQIISKYYFKNILKLINNKNLNNALKENNIIFYYSLHHMIEKYKIIFQINKYISYINQEKINECIAKTNLIITDFSSIIFDAIVRKIPYIIFIPDSIDPNIKNIYDENYYNLINNLRKGIINFENRFFNIKEAINKIIYYINNNFELEQKINEFYKKIHLKGCNHTQKFINYLLNLQ